MSPKITSKLIFQTIFYSFIAFIALSIPTAVIRNIFFTRMTPVYWYDHVFLVINSLLIGLYFGITKNSTNADVCKVERKSIVAQVLAFLGIACPICNKILVYIFGVTFLMSYLEPIRPYLSLLSTLILAWLIAKKIRVNFIPITPKV